MDRGPCSLIPNLLVVRNQLPILDRCQGHEHSAVERLGKESHRPVHKHRVGPVAVKAGEARRQTTPGSLFVCRTHSSKSGIRVADRAEAAAWLY